MRVDTVETEVFKFDELSEEAQRTAIEKLYDLNVVYEWWDGTYDDAANIGLKITGFDTGRGHYVEGDMTENPGDMARLIIENHGETCETHKDAVNFLKEVDSWDDESQAFEEAAIEFERTIKEDYRIILSKEYEYLTSEEAIKETIEANDYEFTAEGNLY